MAGTLSQPLKSSFFYAAHDQSIYQGQYTLFGPTVSVFRIFIEGRMGLGGKKDF